MRTAAEKLLTGSKAQRSELPTSGTMHDGEGLPERRHHAGALALEVLQLVFYVAPVVGVFGRIFHFRDHRPLLG